MNIADELDKHADAIVELQARLDVLEGLKPKADAVQPLVGPPDVVGAAGPAALARPAIIAECEKVVTDAFRYMENFQTFRNMRRELRAMEATILQGLGKLDQGPEDYEPKANRNR